MYSELLGKHVKVVYKDGSREKVVRGILTDMDEMSLTVIGDDNNSPVIIGKGVLVMMRRDEGG